MKAVPGLRIVVPLGVAAVAAVATLPAAPAAVAQAPLPERPVPELQEMVRSRVEVGTGLAAPAMNVAGERMHAAAELPRFYEARGFLPAWVTLDGPTAAAESLLDALERAGREGLSPEYYHLERIRSAFAGARRTRRADTIPQRTLLADLDLLLTDAFLLYGAHLVGGVVNPVTIHPEWNAVRREADLVALLDSALVTGRVREALETLLPRHAGYRYLRDALHRYREVEAGGGFPEIPGVTVGPGMVGPEVAAVRQWLRLAGDLGAGGADGAVSDQYDDALAAAVRRFQRRHGLPEDGVVGLATSGMMNIPVEQLIRTIEVNMERWRWLPRDLGTRHILVNIAGFEMRVVDGDSTILTSRVMVGQRYRRTPVFSDRMTYLVLSPTWTIPPNILEQDKLPLIREDPAGYLARERIRVLGGDGRQIDPSAINWSTVTGRTAYRFRMDPGPENPLGRVKFMFPNPHHVYLHDTPATEGFARARRDFSSGCIRIEHPMELAEYLLSGDPRWTRARIEEVSRRSTETTVPLPRPLPVHLLYWTAWADADGLLHVRNDIYERDQPLDRALRQPPPLAAARAAARADS